MRCKRCGAAVKPGSGFCLACGAVVGRQRRGMVRCRRRVPASGRLCPACGAELRRSWRWAFVLAMCVVLVGGGYYLVAEVITVQRIRQQLARLPRVSLSSLLPQAAPTLTPLPSQPTEARPTPTRIPTATPVTPTPTASPTTTETPLPGSTTPSAEAALVASPILARGPVETRALIWQ